MIIRTNLAEEMTKIETGIEDVTMADRDMVKAVLVTTIETGIETVTKAEMTEEMSKCGITVEAEEKEATTEDE